MFNLDPNREFWEDYLEIPVDHWFSQFQNSAVRQEWINSLSGRSLDVIFRYYFKDKQNGQLFTNEALHKRDDVSVQQQRQMLNNCCEMLFSYYLITNFNHFKSESAVSEVAQSVLSLEQMQPFLYANNKYDKLSLLFILFHTDYELLKQVYHLDKIQKRSFSYFVLQNPHRQLAGSLQDFLSKTVVEKALQEYDAQKNDGFESQLKSILLISNHLHVFIRRASKTDLLISENRIIHGYEPDGIALDFSLCGNQVKISAKNLIQGIRIANIIATNYFQQKCSFVSMQGKNFTSLVETFLKSCICETDANIRMLELKFGLARFEDDNSSLTLSVGYKGSAIKELEILGLSVDEVLLMVQSVKVELQSKKVILFFKRSQEYTTIYYSEYVLNRKEREVFKSLIYNSYGLTILSKPKISD